MASCGRPDCTQSSFTCIHIVLDRRRDSVACPATRHPVQALDIAPAEKVAGGRSGCAQPTIADRPTQPPTVTSDQLGCLPDRQGIADLVEVAVVSKVTVVDGARVDGEGSRTPRSGRGEPTARQALIVGLAPPEVAEDLIRPGDPLEPSFQTRVPRVAIRVGGHRKAAVGGPDLPVGRPGQHLQDAIVSAPPRHGRPGQTVRRSATLAAMSRLR